MSLTFDGIAKVPIADGFRERIIADLGQERGTALYESLESGDASVSLRLNPEKCFQIPSSWNVKERIPWCDCGIALSERPLFTMTPELHGGAFYVQEGSSMIHAHIIQGITGDAPLLVLDLCAAPGGKTTAVSSVLPEGSLLVANEINSQRAAALKENVTKWGDSNTIVTNSPAERLLETVLYDIVMIDAPCSGEGMMRKEPEARRQWTPGLVDKCASLQRSLMTASAGAIKTGGYLLYSTCTFNRSENEDNIDWFCDTYGFETVKIDIPESWGVVNGNDKCHHSLRFFPDLTGSEGLFVCLMRKTSGIVSGKNKIRTGSCKLKRLKGISPEWIDHRDRFIYFQDGEKIIGIPSRWEDVYFRLHESAKTIYSCMEAAEYKGKDIIPSHASVLSRYFNSAMIDNIPLSEQDALSYLRRDNIPLSGTGRGIACVSYNDIVLGRINIVGSRANNMYPKEYRIRKML